LPLPCCAERLAGTTSGPNGKIIRPSSLTQGVTPDADAREEVVLRVAFEIVCGDFRDRAFIDISPANKIRGDQLPEPCRRERIVL
jgi:hypothetical protein